MNQRGPFPSQWMPWWPVVDRGPNRLERWASHMLPPVDMGPEFEASTGEAESRIRVVRPYVFDVYRATTTRYYQRGPQGERLDQVSCQT